MFWLLALLQAYPFSGFVFALFQGLLCVCFGLFSQPPEPKSAPLGHPGDPPHSLLGSLSTLLGLALPLGLEPFVPAGEVPLPLGEVPLPLGLEPFAGEVLAELRRSKMKRNSALHLLQCLSPGQGHSLSQGHLLTLKQAHLLGLLPA